MEQNLGQIRTFRTLKVRIMSIVTYEFTLHSFTHHFIRKHIPLICNKISQGDEKAMGFINENVMPHSDVELGLHSEPKIAMTITLLKQCKVL